MKQHPHEELLRYLDGELPAGRARRIRKHVESCWECRAELADLEKAIGECVRHKPNVLQPDAPPPPKPWLDIYRGFAEIDATTRTPLFARFATAKTWAIAAAAVLLAIILFYRFRETPAVEAAELLRRATAAEANQRSKPRRLEIRTAKHRLTRTLGTAQRVANRADAAALDSLQAIFLAAHYDWNDPLSAKSYQAWHDQLPQKQDTVSQEPGAYVIRTSTDTSELSQAQLKLNLSDLRPMEERFEFRSREWVEISELEPEPISVATAPARSIEKRPAEATPRRTPVAATMADELQVMAALHRIGADLGDPVEVGRSGGEVLVTGIGIPERRQSEIREALRSEAHVAFHFSDPATPPGLGPTTPTSDSAANPGILQLQAEMATRLGGRAQFDEMAAQALDLSEEMMSRAYALHRLALKFTPDAEARMGAADRRVLNAMLQDHASTLRGQAAQLIQVLQPILPKQGGSPVPVPEGAWQPATEQILTSARQVEKLLAVMAGSAPDNQVSDRALPSQVQASVNSLRASLAVFDRRNE